MFLIVYWLTVMFVKQSLGKAAAAAALYTESVSQSLEVSQSEN